jgi:hypothetical protein
MASIRAIDVIGAKWASVTPARASEYALGVQSPRASWSREAQAAQPAWEAGVQASIATKSFSKGVAKAGDSRWARGAIEKGAARFGPGVQIAQADYVKGFTPYRNAIASVNLPPRFARRDPRNLLRVAAIVDAMNAAKKAQVG